MKSVLRKAGVTAADFERIYSAFVYGGFLSHRHSLIGISQKFSVPQAAKSALALIPETFDLFTISRSFSSSLLTLIVIITIRGYSLRLNRREICDL